MGNAKGETIANRTRMIPKRLVKSIAAIPTAAMKQCAKAQPRAFLRRLTRVRT
jgi:hypothetical protein